MTSLNPAFTIGDQIVEGLLRHQPDPARPGAGARHRGAAAGAHPGAGAALPRVPAQAVRRHAPARDDRHGAGLRAAPADRRRADHGAGRHHPGADPRADAHAAGRDRHRGDPDHARPRRGRRSRRRSGGDVCGPHRRAGAVRAIFEQPQHPYTVGLLGSIPRLDVERSGWPPSKARCPNPLRRPPAASFADRCPFAIPSAAPSAAADGGGRRPPVRLLARAARPRRAGAAGCRKAALVS
jgi:oligopeptide/dipeptide ABC transporter ATP-binding protein